ncbi:MAG: vWA domain-containing protein, partial [Candidatus Helarchaeales archaeon]
WDQEGNDEKILEELAKYADTFGDFGGPAVALGLVRQEQALAAWYRNRARGLIEVNIQVRKRTGQLPVAPAAWRLGDPVESLDLTLTLLNSPIIIPNITTRKWEFKYRTGLKPEKTYPDFLIVIDSSGSMNWYPNRKGRVAKGEYDTALVAAFAAIHFAKLKGIKMAAINFSGTHESCKWTRDPGKVEEILLRYQGDGTVLPTREIVRVVGQNSNISLIFIISDAGLYGWYASINPLMDLIKKKHKIIFFLIGANKKDLKRKRFIEFMNKGGKIYPIKNVKDLINLVVTEIKEEYFIGPEPEIDEM